MRRLRWPGLWLWLMAALSACTPAQPEADGPAAGTRAEHVPAAAPPPASAAAPLITPRFERYSVTDGLASGFVRALLQDRQGFLWVATSDGLNRFDGETFREFYHDPSEPTSLSQNFTNRLLEDDLGGIWVGHSDGVDRFDPATETFSRVGAETSANAASVYALAKDAAGQVWIGAADSALSRVDPETGTWTHVPLRGGERAPGSLYAIEPHPDGTLWLGGGSGLHRFDPSTGTLTAVPFALGEGPPPLVFALHHDREGALWVGTQTGGLYRLNPVTGTSRHFPADAADPDALGNGWVLTISEDAAGTLWVGTNGGGLARYDPARGAFDRYTFDASDPSSLSQDFVLAVLEDRSGVLWVGTTSGLNRRLPLSGVVEQHRHRPGDPTSLSANEVQAFVEEGDGALWVGTEDMGLNRRDPATGSFARVDLGSGGRNSAETVFSLALDAEGAVWAATNSGLFRGAGGFFSRVPFSTPEAVPTALSASPDGRLWVGAGDLYEIDVRSSSARLVGPEGRLGSVMRMLAGPRGTVDVATYGYGVYRLGPDGRLTAAWRHDPDDEQTLSADIVSALHRDRRGALWAGTNQGLDRIEEREGQRTVTRYGRAEGLPHPSVQGIADDARGRIWVATSRGLSRLDPATGAIQSYRATDGLQSDGMNAVYQSPRTGRIYVGGDGGYDAFDPAAIPEEAPPGPVVLTNLRLFDEPVRVGAAGSPLPRALSMTDRLDLGPDDDVVTFQFAALDFGAPDQHRYAVRLEGLHGDWLDVGSRRQVTFTALPPGRYVLRVRAAGRDGVWGAPSSALAVVVASPWWRTWWAYLGYLALALALGAAVYRNRQNRLRLQHRMELDRLEAEKLRELDHARSRFFANVSHEFRTPLTLTLGPLDDLKAGLYGPLPAPMAPQVDLARRNAGRVLDLINQILDVARLESGRTPLRARPLDLGAFVEAVAEPFRPLAERKAMTFEVALPNAPVAVYADPPQLEKTVANLLSNALKFTPEGGTVRVSVALGDGAARVAVRDSGPGIPAADLPYVFDRFYQVNEASQTQLGTGIGLALAKEVVDLHGGTLAVASEEGFGSTFTLTLPQGRAHLAPEQVDEAAGPWVPGEPSVALASEPGGDGVAASVDEASDADQTTVLVVEDHPEVRAYVRRHLEGSRPAYRVLEAADGEEGLAKARALLPDLVLSDVMMPKLDGLGLCRALRADPETDFIPIILLTAKAAPEDKLEGLGEHCDDYLTKPFDPAELRARIANLIAVRQRLRERFRLEGMALVLGEDASAPVRLPAPEAVPSADHAFLERVRAAVEAHLGDEDFSVERLAEAVGVSRGHLHRQLKALAGQTPTDLIRTVRLARAAHLLAGRAGTVSEIAYAVGFKSVGHFSDCFVESYGCRPSGYAARAGAAEDETA